MSRAVAASFRLTADRLLTDEIQLCRSIQSQQLEKRAGRLLLADENEIKTVGHSRMRHLTGPRRKMGHSDDDNGDDGGSTMDRL